MNSGMLSGERGTGGGGGGESRSSEGGAGSGVYKGKLGGKLARKWGQGRLGGFGRV